MKLKSVSVILAVLALMVVVSSCGSDDDNDPVAYVATLTINNSLESPIDRVYIVAEGNLSWGDEWIQGAFTIAPGGSYDFSVTLDQESHDFEVRILTEAQDEKTGIVTLTDGQTSSFTASNI